MNFLDFAAALRTGASKRVLIHDTHIATLLTKKVELVIPATQAGDLFNGFNNRTIQSRFLLVVQVIDRMARVQASFE